MDWAELLMGLGQRALFGVGALALHWGVVVALPAHTQRPLTSAPVALAWFENAPVSEPSGGEGVTTTPAQARATLASSSRTRSQARASARTSRIATPQSVEPSLSLPENGEFARAEPGAASAEPGAASSEEATSAAHDGEVATGTASANSGHAVALGNGAGTGTSPRATHGPGLIAQSSPCAGYFPKDARADHGEVQISVEVDAAGHARVSSVLIEAPLGQGFAHAAHDCARQLRFAPAVGSEGTPMPGHATLKLRFDRRSAG